MFIEYLEAKGEFVGFENFVKDKLKKLLTKFYAEARKKDGSDYRKSSLQNLKHGLKRYLREKCDLDISGSEFNDANKVFAAKVQQHAIKNDCGFMQKLISTRNPQANAMTECGHTPNHSQHGPIFGSLKQKGSQ